MCPFWQSANIGGQKLMNAVKVRSFALLWSNGDTTDNENVNGCI
jgi:hypothetical protein